METTTIRITTETKKELDKHGQYRDNYDTIIQRLLLRVKQGQLKHVKPLDVGKKSSKKKQSKTKSKKDDLGSFDNGR